jgi:hypothetical protein
MLESKISVASTKTSRIHQDSRKGRIEPREDRDEKRWCSGSLSFHGSWEYTFGISGLRICRAFSVLHTSFGKNFEIVAVTSVFP